MKTLRTSWLFVLPLFLSLCIAPIHGQSDLKGIIKESDGGKTELPKEDKKDDKKQLTEVQKLKAENFQLKVQLAQVQATLVDRENRLLSIQLTNEQSKLELEFRERLKPNEKDKFDWATLTFISPKPESK